MKTSVIAVLLIGAVTVQANWGWLRGSAASEFEDQDWAMLEATAYDALDRLDDGESSSWRNDVTGNGGTVTPLRSFAMDASVCRRTKFRQEARSGKVGEAFYNVCRTDAGWKLVSDSEVRAALAAEKGNDP